MASRWRAIRSTLFGVLPICFVYTLTPHALALTQIRASSYKTVATTSIPSAVLLRVGRAVVRLVYVVNRDIARIVVR